MDFSKFKTSDWLKVGGGAVVAIAYFLDWTSIDCPAGVPAGLCSDANLSGSSFFFRGTLPWILMVAVGILSALIVLGTIKTSSLPWPLIFLAAAALSTLLILIYLIHPTYSGVDAGRGIGAILAFLGAAAALAGSVIGFQESGGNLNDLKDMNKLKASFNQGSGGTPPPPPPPPSGMTPPPPPPPAG